MDTAISGLIGSHLPKKVVTQSHLDDTAFTDVTNFARDTHWLNTAMVDYSSYGMILFAALIVVGWWRARSADTTMMTAALAVPVAAITAFLVNDVVKSLVAEPRPCYRLPDAFLLEACPQVSDYGFPSNHTAVAAAMATALLLVDRRLGLVAAAATAIMGFSRVYVGAHYPHDVLVGLLVGTAAGLATAIAVREFATPLVTRLAASSLRPLMTTR
jgi:undecaprenyl-diphosphatase